MIEQIANRGKDGKTRMLFQTGQSEMLVIRKLDFRQLRGTKTFVWRKMPNTLDAVLQKNDGNRIPIPPHGKDFRFDKWNSIPVASDADGVSCAVGVCFQPKVDSDRKGVLASLAQNVFETAAPSAGKIESVVKAVGEERKGVEDRAFADSATAGKDRNGTKLERIEIEIAVDNGKKFETASDAEPFERPEITNPKTFDHGR